MLTKAGIQPPVRRRQTVPFLNDEVIVQAFDVGNRLDIRDSRQEDFICRTLALAVVVPAPPKHEHLSDEEREQGKKPRVLNEGELEPIWTAEQWADYSASDGEVTFKDCIRLYDAFLEINGSREEAEKK